MKERKQSSLIPTFLARAIRRMNLPLTETVKTAKGTELGVEL